MHVPNFFLGGGVGGEGDNSIQFINIGRVGDKGFEEWQREIEVEGWATKMF